MAFEPLEVAEGSDFIGVRQISVFAENRIGQLLRLTRLFDGSDVHILGLSVEGAVDCSIVRLLVDDPDEASDMLRQAGFAISESEVLVVELPSGKRGIMIVCAALISGEVNINYIYPLFSIGRLSNCVVIQTDNLTQSAEVLYSKNFNVLQQHDLRWD